MGFPALISQWAYLAGAVVIHRLDLKAPFSVLRYKTQIFILPTCDWFCQIASHLYIMISDIIILFILGSDVDC